MSRIAKHRACRPDTKKTRGCCPPSSGSGNILRSFKDVVQDYIEEYRDGANQELGYFRRMISLKEAIEKAAKAEGEDGAKHDHQRRIHRVILGRAARALLTVCAEIRKCSDFEGLLELVEGTAGRIRGFGELAIYDTALRIGAQLRIEPRYIYLHRGTRKGARALGFTSRRKYLQANHLPKDFAKLRPREIEDCLCIYASELGRLK